MEKDIEYAKNVIDKKINAPKYVRVQCADYLFIVNGLNDKYCIDTKKRRQIIELTKLLIVPRGLSARKTVFEVLAGFQWLFMLAVLTVVYRNEAEKRRYETAILEICRKNGKTFMVAIIFIILFFIEPRFSKFYSVAPDGSLSREVQTQIREIISSSPALEGKFKVRRDDILCLMNMNDYIPLAFSTSRLDGKLPNAFVADEVGALTSNYPIEAMRSGQLTIRNKLGCIISTKYPTINNPFEDEIKKAKAVLDGDENDETIFSLLFEPDDTKGWEDNDSILEQANPLALEIPEIFADLLKKRMDAVLLPARRENFLTKHCNIIYQGLGTETFIDTQDVIACRRDELIDWTGRTVYIGVDLSETIDNTAVAMAALDGDTILVQVMAFIPTDSIELKSKTEKIPYREFIDEGICTDCGGRVIDYSVVEEYVMNIEETFGCTVGAIGYDRRNAMSSAQKWEQKYQTVEVTQHSRVLHPAIKLLRERILEKQFAYNSNRLLELNFQNTRVKYDTNNNLYITKKHSAGKVDEIFAIIDAIYLLDQMEIQSGATMDWVVM